MIVISEINHNAGVNHPRIGGGYSFAGENKIDVRLTIYSSDINIKINEIKTAKQLLLNELLFDEFGFGINEIKKHYPEHFI